MWFFEKLNTPKALVISLALFLVADGLIFLFFARQPLLDAGNVSTTQPDTRPATAPTEEVSAPLEQEEEPTTDGESPTAEGTASSPETTGEPNELRVDVRVVGAPAWLSVQEDGRTVLAQEAPAGSSRRFEAYQEVSIQTGNAGATHVEVNGRDVGSLGASGQAGTWSWARPQG
jgi:hypothetical protein